MASSDASRTVVKAWAWQCQECARECVPIRAESRCMCGHRLKEHTDGQRCCNRSCSCPRFAFIVAEGSWILRCRCKHKHTEHDPASHSCNKAACNCTGFNSPWVCNCDHPWSQHQQILVERQVLRLSGMIAHAQQHTDDGAYVPEETAAAGGAAAAGVAPAAGRRHDKALPTSTTRVQRQQQPQQQQPTMQAGRQLASSAGAASARGLLRSSAASSTSDALLSLGDLTCEVNRWDMLQRGKQ